jgi:hypothetical protein
MPDQANADAALQATVAGNGVVSTQDNQLRSYAEPQADGAVESAGDERPSQCSSNSDIARERLVLCCNEALQRGKQGGLASLQAYRDAGAALREMKELLPRGQFGPIAQARCGCSKQWCARLMQLDREWADVRAALQWADSTGSTLIRKAHSVDGALALVRAWRTAQNGDARPKAATRARRPGPTQREVAHLKKMLNALARYIAVLEGELAAYTGTPNGERQNIDAADRNKVQKVAMLWFRAGTTVKVRLPHIN